MKNLIYITMLLLVGCISYDISGDDNTIEKNRQRGPCVDNVINICAEKPQKMINRKTDTTNKETI